MTLLRVRIMSLKFCADPVSTPGTAATNPTSPAVHSNLVHVECRDIFRPSFSMDSRSGAAFRLSSEVRIARPAFCETPRSVTAKGGHQHAGCRQMLAY